MAAPYVGAAERQSLFRRIEKLRARAGALEQALGDVLCSIPEDDTLLLNVQGTPDGNGDGSGTRRAEPARSLPKWRDPMFAALAESGAASLEITPLNGRHRLVSINGAKGIPMPIERAEFLRMIAQMEDATASASDDFAPWHDKDALALARGVDRHAINVMVGRLRDQLWNDFKISPLLVETQGNHVRFRLRRPGHTLAWR